MVRGAVQGDLSEIVDMALGIFDDSHFAEIYDEFLNILSDNNAKILVKCVDGITIGFAQCQLRYDYVEGTSTSPVGYLEGLFVQESHRRKGYAKELVKECEKWAKSKGCKEFASDCVFDNVDSYNFHKAIGFEEVNRIICFNKKL